MTRGQRRSESYNLSNTRDMAALEALLDEEDLNEASPPSNRGRGARPQPSSSGKKKREKEKFFQLREDAAAQAARAAEARSGGSDAGDIARLREMLGGNCDGELVAEVYAACGGSFEAALDALLAMSSGAGESHKQHGYWVCAEHAYALSWVPRPLRSRCNSVRGRHLVQMQLNSRSRVNRGVHAM